MRESIVSVVIKSAASTVQKSNNIGCFNPNRPGGGLKGPDDQTYSCQS